MGIFSKCGTFFDNEVENEYQLWKSCKVNQYQKEITEKQINENKIENNYINRCLIDENQKFDRKKFFENYRMCVFYKKLYSISVQALLLIAVLYSVIKLISVFI